MEVTLLGVKATFKQSHGLSLTWFGNLLQIKWLVNHQDTKALPLYSQAMHRWDMGWGGGGMFPPQLALTSQGVRVLSEMPASAPFPPSPPPPQIGVSWH